MRDREWHERELLRREAKWTRDEINRQTTYLSQNQCLEAAKSRLADAKLALELEEDRVKKVRLARLVKEYETEVNQLTAALHPEGSRKNGVPGLSHHCFLVRLSYSWVPLSPFPDNCPANDCDSGCSNLKWISLNSWSFSNCFCLFWGNGRAVSESLATFRF